MAGVQSSRCGSLEVLRARFWSRGTFGRMDVADLTNTLSRDIVARKDTPPRQEGNVLKEAASCLKCRRTGDVPSDRRAQAGKGTSARRDSLLVDTLGLPAGHLPCSGLLYQAPQ